MYPENGTNGIENANANADVPQSPTIPHLRHHQPTTDDNNDHTTLGLRHRHAPLQPRPISPGGIDSSSMRIQIQTPFSDLGESSEGGRRKELVVDRAMRGFELKDGMAAGQWGDEGRIRDGMRLVWRGRIVRDEEELGQVVKDVSTLSHLIKYGSALMIRRMTRYTFSTWSHAVPRQLHHLGQCRPSHEFMYQSRPKFQKHRQAS